MFKFVEQKKLENSPTYQKWLKDQESIEIEQAKEEAAQAAERFCTPDLVKITLIELILRL